MLEMQRRRVKPVLVWLAVTGVLGCIFTGITMYEFMHLIHEQCVPQRSAFLSAFFAGRHTRPCTLPLASCGW
jgi:cytochrome o ubiquinol oxidase subunit 3